MYQKASRVAKYLPREFTESSAWGGLCTIFTYILMGLVCFLQSVSFLGVDDVTYLSLDRRDSDMVQANFDIVYHNLECRHVLMQAFSTFGNEAYELSNLTEVAATSLDAGGRAVGERYSVGMGEDGQHHQEHMAELRKEDGEAELDADWSSSHDGFKHKSFEHVVEGHDFTFINFFAGWCSHCQRFHPSWVRLAKQINGDGGSPAMEFPDRDGVLRKVRLVQVNCVDFKRLCDSRGVDAYPTLRLYKADGTFSLFSQRRTEEDIMKFVEQTVQIQSYGWAKHHKELKQGCNVKGSLLLPRVPTYFQISAGKGDQDLNPAMTNVSQRFRHLSFSDPGDGQYHRRGWSGLPHHVLDYVAPMDGSDFVLTNLKTAYVHELKVVSTVGLRGQTAYQFSALHHISEIKEGEIPQVRIYVDFDPISIWVKREEKPWYEFFTSLLALMGGAYAMMRLVSNTSLAAFGLLGKALFSQARGRSGEGVLDTGVAS